MPRSILATLCAIAAGLLCLGAAGLVEPVNLGNGLVSAEFGDRGLVAISTAKPGFTVRLPRDDFEITLNGRAIASRTLAFPVRET